MEVRVKRSDELYHYGVKGMKWGVRRYEKYDGRLTPAEKKRYNGDGPSENTKKSKHRLALENKYRKAGYSNKDAEEKANRAIKIEKAIAIAGGVTVAAATAYVASKEIRRRIDGKIKWGTSGSFLFSSR